MFTPLSDNADHIKQLCARFNLGQLNSELSSVAGGFHHRTWRLDAENGLFVVKQLSADTDLGDETVIKHFNVTEAVAGNFAQYGVTAISALTYDESYLQVLDDEAYLVYPWTDAVALDDGEVSTQHALTVARLLATLHAADIQVPGVESEMDDACEEKDVSEIISKATRAKLEVADTLSEQCTFLERIARQYQAALPLLKKRLVVSHGDLDQKNVLWDSDNNPVIIDWESAQKLNPTHEVITVALDWSGISADFDENLYTQFVAAYSDAGGSIKRELVEAALHGVLGKWLDWLLYNTGRLLYLEDDKQRAVGDEQIRTTLPIMLKLERLFPTLLEDLT